MTVGHGSNPFVSRKMKKNLMGIFFFVLTGVLICFALAHLIIIVDPYSQRSFRNCDGPYYTSGGGGLAGNSKSNYHLLKSNRRSILKNTDSISSIFIQKTDHIIPPYRVVHLDLKGAPPKISYLKEIFPLIAKSGANAVLIEYEDMFPYRGKIVNASALNAFTVNQIQEILESAKLHQLEVIPLVQTFGHLEHVLKLEEFVHLREVLNNPSTLCPTKNESFDLIQMMIDQVMALHQGYPIKFIHIGSDEVFQLGLCSKCRNRMKSEQKTSKHLFVDHVAKVAQYVKTQYHVQPIIWDDMLRSMSTKELQESQLGTLVEPMVWVYVEDIDHFIDKSTWSSYGSTFEHVWAASAFKGAFGERLFMPNVQRHYRNNLAWLDMMTRESRPSFKPLNFRGITLTGWSRYDHFAVLCELLPVALPSLILNLQLISSNVSDVAKFRQTEKILRCSIDDRNYDRLSHISLDQDPHQFELRRCKFPGAKIFGAVGSLVRYKTEVEALDTISRETQGWLTSYNIRHNYTSPWRLNEVLSGHSDLQSSLNQYREKTSRTLSTVFEKSTVDEWVEQNIRPLQEKTEKLLQVVDKLTARNTWPRRPIP